jgi:hypothetical protein
MLFLTKLFGVTGSDSERNLSAEPALHAEIVEKVLLMQARAARQDHRPLLRGTHAKGVTGRAQFEVPDVTAGRDMALGARLAQGIFRTPGIYHATVRFANSDSRVKSDFKPDVRSLSFSVELPGNGRQDFSLQSAPILPINDAPAFLAIIKLLTPSNPAAGLWALSIKDQLRVLRTLTLLQFQLHQTIKPYQRLRYWSNTPFRHGPVDVVKYSATPCIENPARILQRDNPNALKDELIRHIEDDYAMSAFDFGVQLLDINRMTYWGRRRDANFWIENASVEWNEAEAPFHTIARLTLLAKSHLRADAADATYIDVTGNSTPDSRPLGSMNRARWQGELASREARMRSGSSIDKKSPESAAYAD